MWNAEKIWDKVKQPLGNKGITIKTKDKLKIIPKDIIYLWDYLSRKKKEKCSTKLKKKEYKEKREKIINRGYNKFEIRHVWCYIN